MADQAADVVFDEINSTSIADVALEQDQTPDNNGQPTASIRAGEAAAPNQEADSGVPPRKERHQIVPRGKHSNTFTAGSSRRVEEDSSLGRSKPNPAHPHMMGHLHGLPHSGSASSIGRFSASVKAVFGSKGQGLTAKTLARVECFSIPVSDIIVEHKIGEGMVGEVYQGTVSGVPVAIKQLREAFTAQSNEMKDLITELNMLSKDIKHPSIIMFYGVAFRDTHIMLVMELMQGGSIEDYFGVRQQDGRRFRVRPNRALVWCLDMFAGVAFLHQHKPSIVHRDLKPANLMLSADYKRLKIGDFGLSRTVMGESPFARSDRSMSIHSRDISMHSRKPSGQQSAETSAPASSDASANAPTPDSLNGRRHSVSRGGRQRRASMTTFTGTPRYMAPEIANGATDYTEAVDVYSAALIVFFVFAGERPWDAYDGIVAAALAKSGSRPPLPPQIFSAELREIVTESWDSNPALRPSAASVLSRLQDLRPAPGCLGCFGSR